MYGGAFMKRNTVAILIVSFLLLCGVVSFLILIKPIANSTLCEIGPNEIRAGVDFNVQPNGESAIWVITKSATKDTVIYWNDTQLRTDYKNSELLTAAVPKSLYAKSGSFVCYLMDMKTKGKSNNYILNVK